MGFVITFSLLQRTSKTDFMIRVIYVIVCQTSNLHSLQQEVRVLTYNGLVLF